jgi:histidinol-phosphatase (PHP family)
MPLIRKTVDYHVHSTFSCDGRSSIFELCQKAVELGIAEIGFSEHVDFDPTDWGYGFFNYDTYSSEIKRVQEFFEGKLVIHKGVEIDYQRCFEIKIKSWLRDKRFDFTIGSVHYLDHQIIGQQLVAKGDLSRKYDAYLDEVTKSVESGLFDIIGHFYLLRRYAESQRSELDDSYHKEKVKRILKRIMEERTYLEINSKGLREGHGEPIPTRKTVNEYIEDGGRLVSIGSDAHSVKELGNGVKEILDYLSQYDERHLEILFERSENI